MTEYDATEQAYKNGYKQGVKDFAERVTEALYEADDVNPLTEWKIDQIAKELLGERREK